MKHKHAELIHAWADGAKLEVLRGLVWIEVDYPTWFESEEYRIKPEEKNPVVRYLWARKDGAVTANMYSENEIKKVVNVLELFVDYSIKLEWSRTEFPE